MGIESSDYDIATSALPEDITGIFKRTFPVGAQFGVVIVMDGDDQFEVATFRADDRYVDGRRPESIRFVSAREDVERRDFTINGLLYDIKKGKVIDYVQGIRDIRKRLIRTIGDPHKRFEEDKLRLMRAIRFAARFNFSIEPSTLGAVSKWGSKILEVSWERIRDELVKMLMQPNPALALRLLHQIGILKIILPEVVEMVGVKQPDEFHPEGDVFEHTLKMLQLMDEDRTVQKSETLMLAVLLHDIGKPKTFYQAKDRIRFNNHNVVGRKLAYDILKRLKCSNQLKEDVCTCVDNHMNFMNVKKMRQNRLKRFIRQPTFLTELVLHKLDCIASHGDLETYEFLEQKMTEFGQEKIAPPPLITGKKLIEMGYAPGPQFKEILTAVEDLQLEEKITTEEEAEMFVKKNFSKNK
jgi:poly(A) polymerase